MLRTYEDLDEIKCPACNKILKSQKSIPAHCSRCKKWDNVMSIPYSEFDFPSHFQVNFYSPDAEEGVDYISCRICEDKGSTFRRRRILDHVKKTHGLSKDQYLSLYPDAITTCSQTNKKRVATVQDKYGVDNVFQAEEIKDKFDVTETAWSSEAREKRAETNKKKYGHENPLGGEEGAERAQKGMLEKQGVLNPQQDPEIRKRTLETVKTNTPSKNPSGNIRCPNCDESFLTRKDRKNHLPTCDPWEPEGILPCVCGHRATSNSNMKRHKKDCDPWENRDAKVIKQKRMKASMLANHGVEHPMHSPEIVEKHEATTFERHGVKNVFASEEIQEKIKETNIKKRGVEYAAQCPVVRAKMEKAWKDHYGEDIENPFQAEEVKEKIKETNIKKRGVENPSQCPEVQEKTKKTNKKRFGHEYVLSVPAIRKQIKETCEELYGGPAPSCCPEVRKKTQETNMERWGVPWTTMHPELREQQLETMIGNYGSHYFSSEQGRKEIRKAMIESIGVPFALQDPEIMKTVLEKRVQKWEGIYGETHPMKTPEILSKMMKNRKFECPNLFEQRVDSLSDRLYFTGDGTVIFYLKSLDRNKNPDFIVLPTGMNPEDVDADFLATYKPKKVVEAFGNYWHGPKITGMSRKRHEQELVDAYAEEGIECLVIWEGKISQKDLDLFL